MSIDEGYIKYKAFWNKKAITIDSVLLNELNRIRSLLVNYHMIGKIPNGPGYGNISVRSTEDCFLISGTNTGHLSKLESKDISLVTHVNVDTNSVWNSGETQASSESMSHAVIYKEKTKVNAVIHIHYNRLWEKLLNTLPTIASKIEYGTPELAYALAEEIKTNNKKSLLILGGHEDGIISYGSTLQEAYEAIEEEYLSL